MVVIVFGADGPFRVQWLVQGLALQIASVLVSPLRRGRRSVMSIGFLDSLKIVVFVPEN